MPNRDPPIWTKPTEKRKRNIPGMLPLMVVISSWISDTGVVTQNGHQPWQATGVKIRARDIWRGLRFLADVSHHFSTGWKSCLDCDLNVSLYFVWTEVRVYRTLWTTLIQYVTLIFSVPLTVFSCRCLGIWSMAIHVSGSYSCYIKG